MKKNIKATIAIASASLLLMGGAGSLAFWNSTAAVGPAAGSNTITAGKLTITPVDGGSWSKAFYNAGGTQVGTTTTGITLSNVKIVPGNRLVYTQTFNVDASGDDLWFTISATPGGGVTAASAGAANTALAAQINATANAATISGGNVVASTTNGTYKVGAGTGPSTITVTWTIDFPFGSTAVNTAQNGAVNLTQGSITLTQVAAP